ncbi:MAG: hypothetical protein ACJ79E_07350, partial [Anaeromyxobacteraceae bacterium]
MTRRALPLALAAAIALGLAACPLPQPVPDVARTVDGGAITTPIILPDSAVPGDVTVFVRTDCAAPGPAFALSATVEDVDTSEGVDARWFVDYRPEIPAGFVGTTGVPASGDPNDPLRPVAPFTFRPYNFDGAVRAGTHVVDLVVSNNFLGLDDPTPPRQR